MPHYVTTTKTCTCISYRLESTNFNTSNTDVLLRIDSKTLDNNTVGKRMQGKLKGFMAAKYIFTEPTYRAR